MSTGTANPLCTGQVPSSSLPPGSAYLSSGCLSTTCKRCGRDKSEHGNFGRGYQYILTCPRDAIPAGNPLQSNVRPGLFRVEIPSDAVVGQKIRVQVPCGYTQAGQTVAFVINSQILQTGSGYADIPLPRDGGVEGGGGWGVESTDVFIRILPTLVAQRLVSRIVEGMLQHRDSPQVQERACEALLEMMPQVDGEAFKAIKLEAGHDLRIILSTYAKMCELGVIRGVLDTMSVHAASATIAAKSLRILFYLAREKTCREVISQTSNAKRLIVPAAVIDIMRQHETNAVVQSWACRALQNISHQHYANSKHTVLCGGPSTILTAMELFPGDTHVQLCGCQTISNLAVGGPFSQDFSVDKQAVCMIIDKMQAGAAVDMTVEDQVAQQVRFYIIFPHNLT